MIPESTIRNEKFIGAESALQRRLGDLHITSGEHAQIESLIDDLHNVFVQANEESKKAEI